MIGSIRGPIWPDACGHGGYIGSFECSYKNGASGSWVEERCDLYVWRNPKSIPPVSVCIRHSEEPPDYYSPSVESLLAGRDHEPYRTAYEMLAEKGWFVWEPRLPESQTTRSFELALVQSHRDWLPIGWEQADQDDIACFTEGSSNVQAG